MEPLIVKTMLQSKLESGISFPEHFPVKLLLKKYDHGYYTQINSKRLGSRTDG